ncbi:hypothetical protein ACO2Q9_03600 [Variovorax sp. VNK109]|uniref:hypothetical protein n=1 Tax=Variovorax sp. VNK109 TaxID=3400919 RepID=UPI003C0E94BC
MRITHEERRQNTSLSSGSMCEVDAEADYATSEAVRCHVTSDGQSIPAVNATQRTSRSTA